MSAPWKGPLRVEPHPIPSSTLWDVVDADGVWLAIHVTYPKAEALVHRANAYDALVEALERAEFALRWAKTNGRISYEVRTNMNGEYCDAVDRFNATMVEIRAALALASPEKTEAER